MTMRTRGLPGGARRLDRADHGLALVDPSVELGDAFYAMVEEFRAAGEAERIRGGFVSALKVLTARGVGSYVKIVRNQSVTGVGRGADWVPSTAFWLVRGSEVVGLGCCDTA